MAFVLTNLSNMIIPALVFYIIAYGLASHCKIYEDFVKGAKEGLKTVVGIMPTLVALMIAVGVLRSSGFLDFLEELFLPVSEYLHFPAAFLYQDVFFFGCYRAGVGYFQELRDRFLYRACHFDHDELYGNDFLYNERLFSGGEGHEDQIYAAGSTACHDFRDHSQCGDRRGDQWMIKALFGIITVIVF